MLDLDLVASLFGSLVAALSVSIGGERWQAGKCEGCEGGAADLGKRTASQKSDHGVSLTGVDGPIVRVGFMDRQAGLPALVQRLALRLHRE